MGENNHAVGAAVQLAGSVNWDAFDDLQPLIAAANHGMLGPALTDWLRDQAWRQGRVHGKFFKSRKEPVHINFATALFSRWFGHRVSDRVTPHPRQLTLDKDMGSGSVVDLFGEASVGRARVATSIASIWSLLEVQPNGQIDADGLSITAPNVFFVGQAIDVPTEHAFFYRINTGKKVREARSRTTPFFLASLEWFVLRIVGVCWDGSEAGWRITAHPLTLGSGFDPVETITKGSRVFSYNPPMSTESTSNP